METTPNLKKAFQHAHVQAFAKTSGTGNFIPQYDDINLCDFLDRIVRFIYNKSNKSIESFLYNLNQGVDQRKYLK